MDDKTWQDVCRFFDHVKKKRTDKAMKRVFLQNCQSVIDRIPKEDSELLEKHWQATMAVHPFLGTKHIAPLFIMETNFTSGSTPGRSTGMSSDGCCFTFETRLVCSAPGEVVQSIIAHELAHAVIHVKYLARGLELPMVTLPMPRGFSKPEEYPEDQRHEESLVHEMVFRWGFREESLELWEVALEGDAKGAFERYSKVKACAACIP